MPEVSAAKHSRLLVSSEHRLGVGDILMTTKVRNLAFKAVETSKRETTRDKLNTINTYTKGYGTNAEKSANLHEQQLLTASSPILASLLASDLHDARREIVPSRKALPPSHHWQSRL